MLGWAWQVGVAGRRHGTGQLESKGNATPASALSFVWSPSSAPKIRFNRFLRHSSRNKTNIFFSVLELEDKKPFFSCPSSAERKCTTFLRTVFPNEIKIGRKLRRQNSKNRYNGFED
jgi:hypothetical protein